MGGFGIEFQQSSIINIVYYFLTFIMLLIETRSEREQKMLEEQFCRQGDYFAIPKQKVSQIEDLIDSVLFDMFYDEDEVHKLDSKNRKESLDNKLQSIPLVHKIKKLVSNALHMTISLSTLRQIFDLVKKLNQDIREFQNYFLQLDQVIDEDIQHHVVGSLNNQSFEEIANICDESYHQNNATIHTLSGDLFDLQNNSNLCTLLEKSKHRSIKNQPNSLESIQQNEQDFGKMSSGSSDSNKYTRTSLHFEIRSTPKISCLHEMFNAKLHESFSSDGIEQQSISQIQNVKDQIAYDRSTNTTLYSPAWKAKEDEQKKLLEKALGIEPAQKKNDNYSREFLNNLSGKFNPSPSILNDQSFDKIARKQAKQDIQKSVMIKSSVFSSILGGLESSSPEISERMYNYNIKNMKLQNKLRSAGKLSPHHKSPNFRRKLSNGQERAERVENGMRNLAMSRSQTGFDYQKEQMEITEKQRRVKSPENQRKSGGILSNIFRFKKDKQIKADKQRQKKIFSCLIE